MTVTLGMPAVPPEPLGVNAGSLDKRLLAKHGKATAEALAESARTGRSAGG